MDAATLREATERVVAAITGVLEEIRGETAPPVRYDPRFPDRSTPATESADAPQDPAEGPA